MKHIIVLVLIGLCISCDKQEVVRPTNFEVITPESSRFDLVFPKTLWAEILNSAPLTINTANSVYEIFETLPMQVELAEKRGGVFGGTNYRFEFKEFGGFVDFDTYFDRQSMGSFSLYFNFPNLDNVSNMKVYFLSWSEHYEKDGETFGNGCSNFYDITSYFRTSVFGGGLLLHTKDYRYLDLVAGRLYFVNYTEDKIQLAQVTLTDSKLEERLCTNRL